MDDISPLTEWRKERGYTQQQCAALVGTSTQTWINYERGRHGIGRQVMEQLLDIIGPDIEDMMEHWYEERRRKMMELV